MKRFLLLAILIPHAIFAGLLVFYGKMMKKTIAVTILLFSIVVTVTFGQTPATAEGFLNRGNEYYKKGDFDSAIADHTHGILRILGKKNPAFWQGRLGAGELNHDRS